MSDPATEDLPASDDAPISVRLGTVVPPEDPEDWRRPLTWLAAAGMLLGPIVAFAWFLAAPPSTSADALPATYVVTGALVIGSVVTGATQQDRVWAFTGTLGSGLFGAVLTVLLATVASPQRGSLSPTPVVVHALVTAVAGVAGALAASTLMPTFVRMRSRVRRGLAPAAIGVAVAVLVIQLLFTS